MRRSSGIAMTISLVALGGLLIGVVYSPRDGVLTAGLLAVAGSVQIACAHTLARRRARAGSLARQFQVAVALVIGLTLVGVVAIALAMFVSPHDAAVMALLLVFAGALGAWSAALIARGVMDDVVAIRDGVRAIGQGERDVAIETGGRDELAELASAATEAGAQLTEREDERDAAWAAHRDLIAAVSHDLRTPLTSLRLLSEAVRDEVVDLETRERYLAQMATQVRSLGVLVDDLFELSRLEGGAITMTMERVRLDQLFEETVDAIEPQARAKGIQLVAQVATGMAAVHANPEKLQRVLFNLLQNAIRHTPPDGSVTVAAQPAGAAVEIEVADSGEGVPADDRERVFEPFFRGSRSRSGEGAGLGLAICRAIVEAHGGRIWLADSLSGTRVRLSLPGAA